MATKPKQPKPTKPTTKTLNPIKKGQIRPNGNHKFDHSAALQLKIDGYSYQQIADFLNVSKPAVFETVGKYLPDIDLKSFTKHEADILQGKKALIAEQLTPERLEKLNGYQLSIMYDIFNKNYRLLTNQSTSNVASLLGTVQREIAQDTAAKG